MQDDLQDLAEFLGKQISKMQNPDNLESKYIDFLADDDWSGDLFCFGKGVL
jgi:hypothetical protein